MHRTYSGLGDEQANRREGKVRDIEAILMDRDSTGTRGMGGESGGGRSTKLLEEKFITREFNQYGGC